MSSGNHEQQPKQEQEQPKQFRFKWYDLPDSLFFITTEDNRKPRERIQIHAKPAKYETFVEYKPIQIGNNSGFNYATLFSKDPVLTGAIFLFFKNDCIALINKNIANKIKQHVPIRKNK